LTPTEYLYIILLFEVHLQQTLLANLVFKDDALVPVNWEESFIYWTAK